MVNFWDNLYQNIKINLPGKKYTHAKCSIQLTKRAILYSTLWFKTKASRFNSEGLNIAVARYSPKWNDDKISKYNAAEKKVFEACKDNEIPKENKQPRKYALQITWNCLYVN